jgi:NAD(P)-dependent dehydrogenase (short-subunit alcohol dehydrogenase family)
MASETRALAIVTGASMGIGYELAKCCARNGYDLLIAADEPAINQAAASLRDLGAAVDAVQADLSTIAGVDKLYAAIGNRTVEALLANAGRGLGKGFLDQTDFFERADMMDTKVGTSKKDDAAEVAETGFKAMMKDEGDVVSGWQNKLMTAIASVTPSGMLAKAHSGMAASGTAKH